MQKLIISLLFFSLFVCEGAKAQQIEKHKTYYVTLRDTTFLTEYTIRNDSDRNLLIWFDLNGNNRTQKDYFYKTKGDFSLLSVLNDDNFVNKRFDIIGLSFLKEVKKKEVFSISVLYKNKKVWSNDLFDQTIIVVNENDWQPGIKDAIKRNEEFLYEARFIAVSYESLMGTRKPKHKTSEKTKVN